MKERLLRAYFGEGELMSDPDTLVRLAVSVGLAEDDVREMLAGDRFADEVRDDERTAHAFGISAVPTFVVDRSIGVSQAPTRPTRCCRCCARAGSVARRRRR